ncbi:MAG: hypothetical protein A3F17_03105 [Gammaproteobacteria bacterium RIFCSPHIGHO2_12_FULL_41_15]|nr:MAG: hypothetical protein A3F17_03105 [Gammaproteobacteria bacterium RIFCSPHIGHO2_12_FULL_41_15]
MKLPQFCIERPVFATVLSLVLIILGVMGLSRISVRGYPDVSAPVVVVMTTYSGASASVIENQITTPIENELAGVSDLDEMSSSSSQAQSRVILHFNLGVDVEAAVNDVRDHLSRIQNKLPKDANVPIIQKHDPDSVQAIILSVTDTKLSSLAITDYVTRQLMPRLQEVDGVSSVDVDSAGSYALRAWLNPSKMEEHKVSVSDIVDMLAQKNIDVPSGQVKDAVREYSVLVKNMQRSAEDFSKLILRDDNGFLLRFGDVANIVMGSSDTENMAYADGKPMVALEIYAQNTVNPIQVVKDVRQAVQQLSVDLPSSMKINVVWDSSLFLQSSLDNVYHDLFFALILVMFVVLGFLGNWRSAIIPVITIPICLISVFAFMYFVGFSLNIFTLLALVLAIGLVVDDAIVMLENIWRYIEQGMPVMRAAMKGSKEIAFAVVAMTITLAAVYAPIGFAKGMTGIVFREFAYTLAMAVIISGFVALTLSPMMCSRLLKPTTQEGRYSIWLDRCFAKLTHAYQRLLRWVLHKRLWVVGFLFLFTGLGSFIYYNMSVELAPREDIGVLMMSFDSPPNASMPLMDKYAKQVNAVVQKLPELDNFSQFVSSTEQFGFIILKPWNERTRSAEEIAKQLTLQLKNIAGIQPMVHGMSMLGGGGKSGGAFEMSLSSNADFTRIKSVATKLMAEMEKNPGFARVDDDLVLNNKQYQVRINDNLAESLGVSMTDINETMRVMLGGLQASEFEWNNYDYPVIIQLPDHHLQSLKVLNQLYVRSTKGNMIPLSTVASVQQVFAPTELDHYNRLRSDDITAQLSKNYSMGQAMAFAKQLAQTHLPDDFSMRFKGTAKKLMQSGATMAISFGLALLFIYMVLAAQFESFIDPFIILLTVPLAIVGAIITLYLTQQQLSIYTNIGFVTLIGLIAKHGILITEYANQLRRQGIEFTEALLKAASLRLRPILMTTFAMVIGAVPLVAAQGAGKIGRQQIGWVIFGGMLIGTVFSLLVVPVAYSFFARFRQLGQDKALSEDTE